MYHQTDCFERDLGFYRQKIVWESREVWGNFSQQFSITPGEGHTGVAARGLNSRAAVMSRGFRKNGIHRVLVSNPAQAVSTDTALVSCLVAAEHRTKLFHEVIHVFELPINTGEAHECDLIQFAKFVKDLFADIP